MCVCSHGATLVLVCVRVFEAESLLGSIFLQVGELFTVDGSTTLPETHTKTSNAGSQWHYGLKILFFNTLTAQNITDIFLSTFRVQSTLMGHDDIYIIALHFLSP